MSLQRRNLLQSIGAAGLLGLVSLAKNRRKSSGPRTRAWACLASKTSA